MSSISESSSSIGESSSSINESSSSSTGGNIESSETIQINEIMKEVDEMNKFIQTYWANHIGGQHDESKINDLTTKLYGRLKADHPKFNSAYPVLLFTFARGIYHRDTVLKYFDDVRRNGLGNDTQQAKQLARYTAHAVASLSLAKGIKIKKKMIKEHQAKVYENIISIKKDFSTAMEEIKKQRTEDAQNVGAKRQEQESKILKEIEQEKEEIFNVFRNNNISETNETFKKSKAERLERESRMTKSL